MNNGYFFVVDSLDKDSFTGFYYSNSMPDSFSLVSEQYSVSAVQDIAQHHPVTLILPVEKFSLHYVELPKLKSAKAMAVLPYAIEEQLADDISHLHFAFTYQQDRYLVAACSKYYFQAVVDLFEGISTWNATITLDWCALNNSEIWLTETGILIRQPEQFNGFLPLSEASLFLSHVEPTQNCSVLRFSDSLSLATDYFNPTQIIETPCHHHAITRLSNHSFNLLQGDFLPIRNNHVKRWVSLMTMLLIGCFILWCATSAYKIYYLNQKIKITDQQIAVIYHQYFPSAKQVISPRFRIEQLLKHQQSYRGQSVWELLNRLSLAFKVEKITLQRLSWQDNTLQITLTASSFDALQSFQTALNNNQTHVKQLQASSENNGVLSSLELTLI